MTMNALATHRSQVHRRIVNERNMKDLLAELPITTLGVRA